MKYYWGPAPGTTGPVPVNEKFQPETEGWTALKEPTPGMMNLLSIPAAAILLVVLVATVRSSGILTGDVQMLISGFGHYWYLLLLVFPVHELAHVLAHPDMGRSDETVTGIWLTRLMLYAHFTGQVSKTRFMMMLLFPFLLLTVLPLLSGWMAGIQSLWLAVIIVWNGVLSCGDLIGIAIILFQVPKTAVCRNKGYFTWWRNE